MSKALSLGNGVALVNLDSRGQVRDFYFPYVGLENHVGNDLVHRLGVWVDEQLSWTSDPAWQIKITMSDEALVGQFTATHPGLEIKLESTDLVFNEKNIFIRRIKVQNLASRERLIKIFFGQEFEMYQSHMAHTAYFDPHHHCVVHYRNKRAFAINAQLEGKPFDEFCTGVFGSEGKQGTFLDAADGKLEKNPIEHGRADSVIGASETYRAGEAKIVSYWVAVGYAIKEVLALNQMVIDRGIGHIIESTANYWRAWVNRRNFNFHGLAPETVGLFKKSLLIIRAHADSTGGIIASCDFTNLQQGKDTYNYVWPRDAAIAAQALTRAGDTAIARNFFAFCNDVLTEEGYLMHKYSPDKSLGSSWHPWLRKGKPELPIQEDETGQVLWNLWQYYQVSKDLEFIESIYTSLIRRAADFMVLYRDNKTGLPKPSYDLWEEKFGVSTYTACCIYAALMAAANFARLLGKVKNEDTYTKAAAEVKAAILKYLYNESTGHFYKMMTVGEGEIVYDTTVDISTAYGLCVFGVLSYTDERTKRMFDQVKEHLELPLPVGGLARYERDIYCRVPGPDYPGNPWFITTLWRTQYWIKIATSEKDLERARADLSWTVRWAQSSGLLAEQIDPFTGAQLSVSPLVWSHSEFVLTVIAYLDKLEELGVCKACNPVY
jgi:oligosaccharide amylase